MASRSRHISDLDRSGDERHQARHRRRGQRMIRIEDVGRVRIITLCRPEARNAFNEQLYDDATEALVATARDNAIAVAVITGEGEAFSAGADLIELAQRTS